MKVIKTKVAMLFTLFLLCGAFFSGQAMADNCKHELTPEEFEELYSGD